MSRTAKKRATKTSTRKRAAVKTAAKTTAKKTNSTTRSAVKKKATAKAAKTTAKKTTRPKKTTRAAKKQTSKRTNHTAPRLLVCANDDQCFWVNDGQILQDLQELQQALKVMANEVFTHHVSKERNDFADWVEHILQDEACAADLRRSRTPRGAHVVITRHLKGYTL